LVLVEAWDGSAWTRRSAPTPSGSTNGSLNGVSCTSTAACTAVGTSTTSNGDQRTLAERWNGSSWSIKSSPNPTGSSVLSGVSCTSATACVAVGNTVDVSGTELTLAERWNGSAWSIMSTPEPAGASGSELDGVSCAAAAACVAVGFSDNGAGVQRTLTERWNGSSWSIKKSPNVSGIENNMLSGVSCVSGSMCVATGHSSNANGDRQWTLAERWNGSAWSIMSTPNRGGAPGSNLAGVSCSSPTACTGAGSYSLADGRPVTLAERWNGSSWSIQNTPQPPGIWSWFMGVSCPSPTTCAAVAVHLSNQRHGETLAMGWDGTSWSVQPTPTPTGAMNSQISGVSCSSPAACTAVGQLDLAPGPPLTLAERWDGSTWSIETTPTPLNSYLLGVSCPSAAVCIAVGGGFSPTTAPTVAERWNGSTWSVMTTANPTGAEASQLDAVSCTSASACDAAGYYTNSSGKNRPLVEHWNGTRWSIQPTPRPAGASAAGLSAVSCTLTTACSAVGDYTDSTGTRLTLAERWDGSSWVVQVTPDPAGETTATLSAVSCASASVCAAVGNYVDGAGTELTLAERWNGSAWSIESTPEPGGASAGELTGLDCASTSTCVAVGDYTASTGAQHTLAEGRDGTGWTIQSTPNPATHASSIFTAVSCPSASVCTAVGDSFDINAGEVPLAERYS
jgi:hypothetical protein